MKKNLRICVVGLGLIGGSLAKALSKTKKHIVDGYDINKGVCEKALLNGCINAVADFNKGGQYDIVFIALSPALTTEFVKNNADFLKGAIVSDVCGVKAPIFSALKDFCKKNGIFFIGGHPMAGRELNGFDNSTPDLFINRYYIFTKDENTREADLNLLKNLALDIGCTDVTITTPEKHDQMIAFTSQLPHILAGTYMKSPSSEFHLGFSAGSYHDVSRVASIDENLWAQLFLSNKDCLLEELDIFIENINNYRNALNDSDADRLKELIKTGRMLKERDLEQNGEEKPHNFG